MTNVPTPGVPPCNARECAPTLPVVPMEPEAVPALDDAGLALLAALIVGIAARKLRGRK